MSLVRMRLFDMGVLTGWQSAIPNSSSMSTQYWCEESERVRFWQSLVMCMPKNHLVGPRSRIWNLLDSSCLMKDAFSIDLQTMCKSSTALHLASDHRWPCTEVHRDVFQKENTLQTH